MATPIYRKIKDLIMQEIEDKAANSPIDSERDMAVRFDASRMTVRKAIDELVDEGFLYRDKNKGTFVADRKLLRRIQLRKCCRKKSVSSSSCILM